MNLQDMYSVKIVYMIKNVKTVILHNLLIIQIMIYVLVVIKQILNVCANILPEWMVVSVSLLNWLLSLYLGLIQPSTQTFERVMEGSS